ncbi:hypothetical protein AB0A63_20325 [Lentzea sp. NPDC042327]|uniref:hypothetical protein n=1 Tax=Lentzea sp. NPDC042327 TaxID=3154801 RepID=UPI0033C44FA8
MSDDERPAHDEDRTVSRRRFLYLTGAGGLVLAVARAGRTGPGETTADVALTATATRTLHLRRREDALNLRIDLFNADLAANGTELRKVAAGSAFMVVHFPPQAVLEKQLAAPLTSGDLPLATRVAGPSRLAFDITSALPMATTVDALLAWAAFTPRLTATATATQTASALVAPIDTETALELPWRVLLSPDENQGWRHSAGPVTRNGWTELWHTRLAAKTGQENAEARALRAIWLADPQMASWVRTPSSVPEADDVLHVLGPRQRFALVRLSADPTLRTGLDPSLPKPVEATGVALSSLGATFEAEGTWSYPSTSSLQLKGWQHRASLGRDHLVRTENAGFLFPYGHRASLVDVAERRFGRRPNPDGTPGPWYAYLHRTQHIVVQQTRRTYWADTTLARRGREVPFAAIEVLTRITPPLATPQDFAGGRIAASFIPKAASAPTAPLPFHLRGVDHDGQVVDFTVPVVFVPDSTTTSQNADDLLDAIHTAYNTRTTTEVLALRTAETGGHKVALAHRGTYPAGSTASNVDRIVFGSAKTTGQVPFHPVLERAVVRLPEVAALTGGAVGATPFEYAEAYLVNGIDHSTNNPGGVYLALHPAAPQTPLAFSAAATGGMATPSGDIKAMSAKNGPVTVVPVDAAKEVYDPAKMFGDVTKAKVLGGVPVKDLLPALTSPPASIPDNAPRMSHRLRDDIGAHEWTMLWTPKIEAGPKALPVFEPLGTTDPLTVLAVYTHPVDASVESGYRVNAELRDFALHLFGTTGPRRIISLEFDFLRYSSGSGSKTAVDCGLREVSFHNAFKYVEELAELCSFLGSKLEITAGTGGVEAGLRFAVPTIPLGVLQISELTVHAAVAIPFDGSAVRVNFDLNTRERPFSLRIFGFTGGGYAGVALGADGLERLEVGFVFGAALALDLGVASGGIEALGGISYLLEKVEVVENGTEVIRQQAGLAAYLRMRGSLRFLGLVSVSVEFYLGLTYQEKADGSSVLVGEASITVSIELWLFSETFTVRTRREFAKTPAPSARRAALAAAPELPAHPFGAAFTQQDWAGYCAAFAPVGA